MHMTNGIFPASRRCAVLAVAALMIAPLSGAKAAWPEKPIKIVLPFGAGGVADVTSRIMADKLSQKLGQRVVIENMPGPGGINAAAFKSLPFDPVKDFEPVSMVGTFDLVFVVNGESEYKTLGDFIKAAKAQPGKLNIGTIAVGGTQNLGA